MAKDKKQGLEKQAQKNNQKHIPGLEEYFPQKTEEEFP